MKLVCLMVLMFCCAARASITYLVHIDTRALPPATVGNYQALFFLTDETENTSEAKLPDGFSIDGDIQTDYTHFWADQPALDPVAPPMPINFYLTLQGSPGSPDYFFMAIKAPDGGMVDAPDGGQWLAWAKMDQDSPTLQLDLPAGMQMSAAAVPEPLPVVLMLAGIGAMLLKRKRVTN